MTFLQAAEKILLAAEKPLDYKEMWERATAGGYDKEVGAQNKGTRGSKPQIILVSQIYLEMNRRGDDSKFLIVTRKPVRFWLRERESELPDVLPSVSAAEEKPKAGAKAAKTVGTKAGKKTKAKA